MNKALKLLLSFYKMPLNPDHLFQYNEAVVIGQKRFLAGKLRIGHIEKSVLY